MTKKMKTLYRLNKDTKQLEEVVIDSTLVIDETGKSFEDHVDDTNIHHTASDIQILINTAIGILKDEDDGSSLDDRHRSLKLISQDLSMLATNFETFRTGTTNNNVIDTIPEIRAALETLQASSSSLATLIANTAAAIASHEANTTTVHNIADILDSIELLQSSITNLSSDTATAISELNALISGNTSSIATLNATLNTLGVTVSENAVTTASAIDAISADISDLQGRLALNEEGHSYLTTVVQELTATVSTIFPAVQPDVIGVCQEPLQTTVGNFSNIDIDGNLVTDFIYRYSAFIALCTRDVIIDGRHMKEIDTLYIKTSLTGISGTYSEGKHCWWISTIPREGFRPMLAFKRDGIVKPHVYISKYIGLLCQPDISPVNDDTYDEARAEIEALNVDGATGWRMIDIYDVSLLRIMMLVCKPNGNTQAVWGDNTDDTVRPLTGQTGVDFIGIRDLWRSYIYHVDKVFLDTNSHIKLIEPNTGVEITYPSVYPCNTTGTYGIREIIAGAIPVDFVGDTHDYLELFLPAAYGVLNTTPPFNKLLFYDLCRVNSTRYVRGLCMGGAPYSTSRDYLSGSGTYDSTQLGSGMFMWFFDRYYNSRSTGYNSLRLAKS